MTQQLTTLKENAIIKNLIESKGHLEAQM